MHKREIVLRLSTARAGSGRWNHERLSIALMDVPAGTEPGGIRDTKSCRVLYAWHNNYIGKSRHCQLFIALVNAMSKCLELGVDTPRLVGAQAYHGKIKRWMVAARFEAIQKQKQKG